MKKIILGLTAGLAVLSLAGCSEDSSNSESNNDNKQKAEQSFKTEYKKGETAEHNGMSLTVKEVKWLEPNQFSDLKDGQKYCAVKVEIKNNSKTDKDYNPLDFKLNDNGNKVDMYETPVSENGEYDEYTNNRLESGTLAEGATVSGWLIAGANPNDQKLQLEYTGNMFDSKAKITFNLK